jgi:transposase
MKSRKNYDRSFKEEAVKLAKETNVSSAARSLGIHENTLRKWFKNSMERPDNPFIGSGRKYVSAQDAEKATLLKENRELKRANDILKEALGFFAASPKK